MSSGSARRQSAHLPTFSLWESLAAARAFAYSMPDHVEVMRRTRAEDWYSEEMFARLRALRVLRHVERPRSVGAERNAIAVVTIEPHR